MFNLYLYTGGNSLCCFNNNSISLNGEFRRIAIVKGLWKCWFKHTRLYYNKEEQRLDINGFTKTTSNNYQSVCITFEPGYPDMDGDDENIMKNYF